MIKLFYLFVSDDLTKKDSNQGDLKNAPKLLNTTCNTKANSGMNLLAASYGDISSEDENAEDGKVAKPYYWKTDQLHTCIHYVLFLF